MNDGVLIRYLTTLVDVMEQEYSVPSEVLYRHAGLQPLTFFEAKDHVAADYADTLWASSNELCGRRDLGLRVGLAVRYTSYASLGHMFVTCKTVGDAIRAVSANALYVGAGRFELEQTAAELKLTYVSDTTRPADDMRTVASLLPFSRFAKWTAGGISPLRVWLRMPGNSLHEEYVNSFRAPVSFGATTNGMAWSLDVLEKPMVDANPALNDVLVAHVQSELSAEATVTARITHTIEQQLVEDFKGTSKFDLTVAANNLGMSRRSVQRALEAEGTKYRILLAEVRCKKAGSLLCNSSIAIGEISERLGYSEPAAFVRAFKRWHIVSPTKYRAVKQLLKSNLSDLYK